MAWVPVDQQPVSQQQQPQWPQLQIQAPPQFDVATWAAQEATRQMMEVRRQNPNAFISQDMYEDARKEAYKQGMETMRQRWSQYQQQQFDYQKKMQEQFAPRQMTPEEIKDAGGIMGAHAPIMDLYHENQDISANHVYRTTALGHPSLGPMVATDPNIRNYEALRGGYIIQLGRGLLQDTGQVAGKEQAQDLIKQLMPGPGDSQEMAGRKTIDMLAMEMNGYQAKIDALPSNVDSTPLRKAYARAYNDYAPLVNQWGSPAQKTYALASPQQLNWSTAAPAEQVNQVKQPAVQGGFTQATNDQLSAQAGGQQPQAQPQPQTQPAAATQTYPTITSQPAATVPPAYPTIASDQGSAPGAEKGIDIERLRKLIPKTGGPEQDLTLPPSGAGITVGRPEQAYQ